MKANDRERMETLLKQSLPAIDEAAEPSRDLWPAVLQRVDRKPAPVPWYDWALLAGLAGMTAVFPAAIPVFLYYL
jgi:hypothetical protein